MSDAAPFLVGNGAGFSGDRVDAPGPVVDTLIARGGPSALFFERVHQLFRHRGATGVRRYELPLLAAFNFVIDDVLEGGVNGSLNLDGHGKTHSFRLLSLTIRVPAHFVRRANCPGESR